MSVLPPNLYAQGTHTPVTASGTAGHLAGFAGGVLMCVNSVFAGSTQTRGILIPSHGPCPDFSTHSAFGSQWGLYYAGSTATPAGTADVRFISIDADKTLPYVSATLQVIPVSGVFFACFFFPLLPNTRPVDLDTKHLSITASGDLTFPSLLPS